MIVAFIVLVPILVGMVWAFFRFSPDGDRKRLGIYNFGTILLAMILSVAYTLKLRADMINTVDSAWWPVLALIFSLFISIGVIFVSWTIRNLLIFRNKK
jgi:hypothetical protein